jgi:protein O-GlcNAc transferase
MLNWLKRKGAGKAVDVGLGRAPQSAKEQGDEHLRGGRYADAERCYRQLRESDAHFPAALVGLGFALKEQGRSKEAREVLERARALVSDDADVHFLLADLYLQAGEKTSAIESCRRALAVNPELIDAQLSLSRLLLETEQFEQAEISYRREIALIPNHFGPHHQLGVVLSLQGRDAEAAEQFRHAISLNPQSAASYYSLANSYLKSCSDDAQGIALAQENFEKAVELEPQTAAFHCDLGFTYWHGAQPERAMASFDRAIELDPDNARARWARVMTRVPAYSSKGADDATERSGFAAELALFEDWWRKSPADGAQFVGTLQPFFLTYREENNLALLKQYGEVCAAAMQRWLDRQKAPASRRPSEKRIRLGIVSADIRFHSVWTALIKGWLRSFGPKRFEVVVFSLSDSADAETSWARTKADVFVDGLKSLAQWVAAIREQNCEILLYPALGLHSMTLQLASLRLAQVQVTTWGHPYTSGLPTLDYYVSAECLEPPDAQAAYSERLILLPHLGNRVQPMGLAGSDPDFAAMNLDLEKPILVCPGTPFKYQAADDHVFVDIARELPDAQLVFFRSTVATPSSILEARLVRAFQAAGLSYTDHVRFFRWLNLAEFHSLLRRADVLLDTIGFSGYNTAVQAIECGLPLVTREGRFLRGRLASGVLRRMGLDELIAPTKAEYVSLAVRLVADRAYQAHIRHEIEQRRSVLFDDLSAMGPFQDFLESIARPVGGSKQPCPS